MMPEEPGDVILKSVFMYGQVKLRFRVFFGNGKPLKKFEKLRLITEKLQESWATQNQCKQGCFAAISPTGLTTYFVGHRKKVNCALVIVCCFFAH